MTDPSSEYALATTPGGIDLYVHSLTGAVCASQRMLARLVEKEHSTVGRWATGAKIKTKDALIPTPQGIRTGALFDEDAIYLAFEKWKPELLVQCAKAGIRVYLHGLAGYIYKVEQSQFAEDPIIASLKQIMEVRQQQIDHDERISALEKVREDALEDLKALPAPEVKVPEETVDMKVRRIVNDHSAANGVAQGEVWRRLYQNHYYRYQSRVTADKKESKLQAFVRLGKINELYALAVETLALST